MPISLIRIDDRLVHGQIVESWVPFLGIEEIVVVSDEIAGDPTRQAIMRFAVPEDIGLVIFRTEEAFQYLKEKTSGGRNILALLPGLKEALLLLEKGLEFSFLNVGGMHYSAGKNLSIGKAIFLSSEDCGYLKRISSLGVRIEGRGVPSDDPVDLNKATAN